MFKAVVVSGCLAFALGQIHSLSSDMDFVQAEQLSQQQVFYVGGKYDKNSHNHQWHDIIYLLCHGKSNGFGTTLGNNFNLQTLDLKHLNIMSADVGNINLIIEAYFVFIFDFY